MVETNKPSTETEAKNKQTSFKFSLIVSIYNNGEYLKNICFNSLKKLSMFKDIEIILVDDGSTDKKTINIINDICSKYNNVKSYFFNTGGSGSPSRPRNFGVYLATTPYITYLDPDNEAYADGYTKLYNEMIKDECDLVIGEIIFKSSTMEKPNSYCQSMINCNSQKNILSESGRDFLIKSNFSAQSIQSCLIKKSLLIDNNLKMVFGGAGEDTLFFYELLINSKKTKIIKDIIHIYHMSREDSITNDINSNFFKKHLHVELEKRSFLIKHDLLSLYLDEKQDFYFKNFIFSKLNNVSSKSEKEICFQYIDRIYKIFYDSWVVKDKLLKDYFTKRDLYRTKKFDESIVVYLYDNSIKNTLNSLNNKFNLDNVEIIILTCYLQNPENIKFAYSFEIKYKNIKIYYENPIEQISMAEFEKRAFSMITTNNVTYIK